MLREEQVPQCSEYVDEGATALDNVDGDLTANIVTTGLPLDTDELGVFTITYDVVDSAGNQAATKKRFVEVTADGSVCPTFPPPLLPSFEVVQPDADTIWAAQENFKINIVWEAPPDVAGVRISLLSDSEEV